MKAWLVRKIRDFFNNPDREECENCAHNGKQGAPCNECFMFSRWEKIMTNADRIRSMNDDELAKALFSINECQYEKCSECIWDEAVCNNAPFYSFKKFAEWLKLPVGEEP